MKGFFQDALLAKVRIHRLEEGSQPPWFRVRRIAGITLADTIVLAPRAPAIGPAWSRLLFHELVHVVQFEMLGIDEFAARYLGAWMTRGLRYRRIPLEQHVRELERCFAARPSEPFDVETEVAQQLVDGR
jgi:hypothetical protein